mmetsp:Transcript_6840/g.20809  ORF Transcript_6840/g.20809 Transcript_6840/m.20809 type:complete len:219 (-) Transcript_6840:76-732(-)
MATYAFVNGAAPLAKSGFAGRAVAQSRVTRPVAARKGVITMVKSKAMPFMEAPPALDGSMAGDNGFDPLGFTRIFDIRWMREAEIKHGRICMLATVGWLIQELFVFPPKYFPKNMLQVDAHGYFVQTGGLSQVNLFISAFEIISTVAVIQTLQGLREPGDFGFDPLGLAKTPEQLKRWQYAEIVNGRLAMCAIGGFVHQQWIYKTGIINQLFHFKPMY